MFYKGNMGKEMMASGNFLNSILLGGIAKTLEKVV